jgi:hypothetical protein
MLADTPLQSHVPPAVASVTVIAEPTHTALLPVIADIGLTVIALV